MTNIHQHCDDLIILFVFSLSLQSTLHALPPYFETSVVAIIHAQNIGKILIFYREMYIRLCDPISLLNDSSFSFVTHERFVVLHPEKSTVVNQLSWLPSVSRYFSFCYSSSLLASAQFLYKLFLYLHERSLRRRCITTLYHYILPHYANTVCFFFYWLCTFSLYLVIFFKIFLSERSYSITHITLLNIRLLKFCTDLSLKIALCKNRVTASWKKKKIRRYVNVYIACIWIYNNQSPLHIATISELMRNIPYIYVRSHFLYKTVFR